MQVTVRDLDGVITTLAVASARWAPADGSETIDLSDRWSLPGLADAHAHLSADALDLAPAEEGAVRRRMAAAVAAGVFLCLDKGWGDDLVLSLATSPDDPTILAAGRIITTAGGYYPGFGEEVDVDTLRRAVATRAGRPWVKLIGDWPRKGAGALPNFGEEALAAAVSVAHAAGTRVAIHTMAPGVASMAVAAGVDSIEHGLYLTEDDLATMAAAGAVWVPTVLRMEQVLAGLTPGSSGAAVIGAGLENVRRLLPLAAELGVKVLAGSDLAVPVAAVGAEAAALARAGLPPATAVAAAGPAVWGSVGEAAGFAPGLPADLVSFPTHPHHDPAVLTRPVLVMRGGRSVLDR
jgi:imidazolonepropionase-like amidohydrolase